MPLGHDGARRSGLAAPAAEDVDRHVVAKSFKPAFTTKPIDGTGLGLSKIYGFPKHSCGAVSIYSELGHGTNVCIYVRRHIGTAEATEVPKELADASRGEGETALVLDDEPTIRMEARWLSDVRGRPRFELLGVFPSAETPSAPLLVMGSAIIGFWVNSAAGCRADEAVAS